MRIRAAARLVLGTAVSLGMLGMIPATVLAAQPACGATLTSNTTLTADLDCSVYAGTALTFGHNRITLNLNGHTVWGFVGADSYYGIDTNGHNHVVIKNGTVANDFYDIYINGSNGTLVKNVETYGEAADTSSSGVASYYGSGNRVEGLNSHDVYYGYWSEDAAESELLNSTISATTYAVYTEYDSHDLFQGNTLKNNEYGFYDDYSGNNRYISNKAKDNTSYGYYFDCDEYGNITLKNNVAMDNGSDGFYLYYCYNDNGSAAPGSGSVISGNSSSGNDGYGFFDEYSINSVWTGNTATGNTDEGFYIEYPGDYTMTGNKANSNGSDGFYFYDNYSTGYYNLYKFANNKANHNDGYGFDADYGVPGTGNTGRHNSSGNCYNVNCN